jgi:hypothetical protein
MKLPITYIILFMIFLLGVGCGSSHMDREQMYDSLGGDNAINMIDIEGDSLSENNLTAFEDRAIQKLDDLSGFIEILSDTAMDISFKDQAFIMAVELFETSDAKVEIDFQGNTTDQPVTIYAFLKSLIKDSYKKLIIKPEEVSVVQHLKNTGAGCYRGKIQMKGTVAQQPLTCSIHIAAKQVEKEFGGEKKRVWEVFLGEIESR